MLNDKQSPKHEFSDRLWFWNIVYVLLYKYVGLQRKAIKTTALELREVICDQQVKGKNNFHCGSAKWKGDGDRA